MVQEVDIAEAAIEKGGVISTPYLTSLHGVKVCFTARVR